jgi:predicted transposase YdaD
VDWQAVVIFPKRTIETIMVYKFPQLSREDIERMLGLSELRQTKVYQEALMEGEQSLVLRQLSRRLGTGD